MPEAEAHAAADHSGVQRRNRKVSAHPEPLLAIELSTKLVQTDQKVHAFHHFEVFSARSASVTR